MTLPVHINIMEYKNLKKKIKSWQKKMKWIKKESFSSLLKKWKKKIF